MNILPEITNYQTFPSLQSKLSSRRAGISVHWRAWSIFCSEFLVLVAFPADRPFLELKMNWIYRTYRTEFVELPKFWLVPVVWQQASWLYRDTVAEVLLASFGQNSTLDRHCRKILGIDKRVFRPLLDRKGYRTPIDRTWYPKQSGTLTIYQLVFKNCEKIFRKRIKNL